MIDLGMLCFLNITGVVLVVMMIVFGCCCIFDLRCFMIVVL